MSENRTDYVGPALPEKPVPDSDEYPKRVEELLRERLYRLYRQHEKEKEARAAEQLFKKATVNLNIGLDDWPIGKIQDLEKQLDAVFENFGLSRITSNKSGAETSFAYCIVETKDDGA